MENKEWLSSLKLGDKVVVCSWSWSYSLRYNESTVEKITPKGFIKVNGLLYNPNNGYLRGSGGSKLLCPDDKETKEKVKDYKRDCFVKSVLYSMRNVVNITFDQAVKIKDILGEVQEK